MNISVCKNGRYTEIPVFEAPRLENLENDKKKIVTTFLAIFFLSIPVNNFSRKNVKI